MDQGTHEAVPDPRNESILIYVNGDLVPRAEAKVSVYDSGFLVGDGVWESVRLEEGVFVFLDDHLDRLFQGARAIALAIGMEREALTDALRRTVEANGMQSGVHVRLMVTRGVKRTPSQHPRLTVGGPTVVIIAEHKQADPAVKGRGIRLRRSQRTERRTAQSVYRHNERASTP